MLSTCPGIVKLSYRVSSVKQKLRKGQDIGLLTARALGSPYGMQCKASQVCASVFQANSVMLSDSPARMRGSGVV